MDAQDKPGILSDAHLLGLPTEGAKSCCAIWPAELPLFPGKERIPETAVTLNWLTSLVGFGSRVLQAGMCEA